MSPDNLNATQRARLHELFSLAVDLDDAPRKELCARECADDPVLRAELEALLGTMFRDDDAFLARPVLSAGAAPGLAAAQDAWAGAPASMPPDPDRIGPYHIGERIGEGGMGVVYRAEQQEPVRRTVAVKVVKPGMDSARVLARFQAERQALARMDHPGIARIHDSGATAEGRPWFAMDLVQGRPIHEWCNAHRLATRARLELFAELCDAVQHAHQKGVIHRDLKPSNVLVTVRDGRPRPVIIDFGIARAIGEPLTGHPQLTRQHELVGTLEYMAPEHLLTIPQPAGVGSVSVTVPNVPGLVGLALYSQSLHVAYPNDLRLSNVVHDVVQ